MNIKTIHEEEYKLYYLSHNCWDKKVHVFPEGINPKMITVGRLEFELSYFEAEVLNFSHHASVTALSSQNH